MMKTDLADKIRVFRKSQEFGHLDHESLKELATLAAACVFKKGELVFREKDAAEFYFLVQSGLVKCFKQSFSGRQYITRLCVPGQSIGGLMVFSQKPCFISAQAMRETTLLRVNGRAYISFVSRHPSHALKIIASLADVLRTSYDRVNDMVTENAKQRILNVLWALSNKFGDTLAFTCLEISEFSGTTTETVIRTMKELTSLGILQHKRGTIRVLDRLELKKLSQTLLEF